MSDSPFDTAVDSGNELAAAEAVIPACAAAAVELIASPEPLVPAALPTGAPQGSLAAFTAAFSGTVSGSVTLVVDEAIREALADPASGMTPEEAITPALQAAAQQVGTVVLEPVQVLEVGSLPDLDNTAFLGLSANGDVRSWIGLRIAGLGKPNVPQQAVAARDDNLNLSGKGLELLRGVEMVVSVEIGRTRMTVRELLALTPGSVVVLDRAAGAPADLLVNGQLIARGEVVVVDEEFALRVTQLVNEADEVSP